MVSCMEMFSGYGYPASGNLGKSLKDNQHHVGMVTLAAGRCQEVDSPRGAQVRGESQETGTAAAQGKRRGASDSLGCRLAVRFGNQRVTKFLGATIGRLPLSASLIRSQPNRLTAYSLNTF